MEQSKKQIELVSDFDLKERPFIWFFFWNVICRKCKSHPGPVVHISGNPVDPNKVGANGQLLSAALLHHRIHVVKEVILLIISLYSRNYSLLECLWYPSINKTPLLFNKKISLEIPPCHCTNSLSGDVAFCSCTHN